MTITFDKGLETEKSLQVGTINERITENRLTGSSNIQITKPEDFPEIPEFESGLSFETVEISSGGMKIPVYGRYNRIVLFTTQYSESAKVFNLNVVLGYETVTVSGGVNRAADGGATAEAMA